MCMGLSNLMLTGVATPYLHNGIMSADADDATNFEVGFTDIVKL